MVRDVLSEQSLNARGLFDAGAVQQLILSNERFEIDASYVIFSLMCIELWMRNFIDQPLAPGPHDPGSMQGLAGTSQEVLL